MLTGSRSEAELSGRLNGENGVCSRRLSAVDEVNLRACPLRNYSGTRSYFHMDR